VVGIDTRRCDCCCARNVQAQRNAPTATKFIVATNTDLRDRATTDDVVTHDDGLAVATAAEAYYFELPSTLGNPAFDILHTLRRYGVVVRLVVRVVVRGLTI
jgi:hypothetical protein